MKAYTFEIYIFGQYSIYDIEPGRTVRRRRLKLWWFRKRKKNKKYVS